MKPREYYVMLALAGAPRHGQAIAREVQRLSDEAVRLWPATLYGTLDELAERGWIDEAPEHPSDESEKKRFYILTSAGRRALAAETDRLSTLVKIARSRMRRSGAVS